MLREVWCFSQLTVLLTYLRAAATAQARDYFKENFGLHIYGEREPITGVWGGAEPTVGSGGRAPSKGVPLKLEAFYALEVRRKCQNCPLFLYFAKSNVQVSVTIYTVRHKKLHHFVFAITLSYLSLFEYLLVHIYRDKFGTNRHQSHQSHLKGVFILLCEMQHTYTCYDQRRFTHVGLNVITIVLNL